MKQMYVSERIKTPLDALYCTIRITVMEFRLI